MNKMGLKTGGPLIGPAQDNAKGFFERIDVVLQNDYLMKKQNVHYAWATYRFDTQLALKHILADDGSLFTEGHRALDFLNSPSNYPWMLKDPRLCVTVRTWLPLLNFIPAILFTYRHPYDVAMSMHKRETEHFTIGKGLKMWYVYNRLAIEQTNDLCRVTASHRRIMTNPQPEFDRIFDQLHLCGVDVPHKLTASDISSFIDVKLQHGQATLIDTSCEHDLSGILPPDTWGTTDSEHIRIYREVMRAYCALEDGTALDASFRWDLTIRDE